MTETGKLYVVGTPIGTLSDFSPRGIETLESVDYIAAEDTRVTLRLLTHFGIKKPLLRYYKPPEAETSAKILELLHDGNSVALVSDAGMPCISDPGVYLVQRCYEQGIPVESVPCCNAAIAAVAISGIDTARVAFEGFLPVDKKERRQRLEEASALPHTLIYYEAPHKLRQTLADLSAACGESRRAALCRELTKLHEEVRRTTLGEAAAYYAENPPRGEFVLVVAGAEEPAEEGCTFEGALALVRARMDEGLSTKDAVKQVAKLTGFAKNQLYDAILKG